MEPWASQGTLKRVQTSAKKSTAWIIVAVLLNILPWFGGPGWIWSALLLGAAAWIRAGRASQWQIVVWALVVCAHTLDNTYIGLGAIPWLIGVFYALHAVWSLFDLSKIKRGYAPYAIFGALLCVVSLYWTWGEVPALNSWTFMGGLDLNTHIDANGNSSLGTDYNATKWIMPIYYPGWKYSGHALNGSFTASLIALAILGWVLWRDEAKRHTTRILPLSGAVLLVMWSFTALGNIYIGPKLFFAGALGMAFCSLMALRGQQDGKYDVSDVTARVKAEVGKRTAPR
ncbi:hypothetical protein IAD21_01923 [Abditibacteriota bacterium]|nr:hypothetical protein IAD21_01923 [Abditibacteriota bacterium]